MSVRAIWIISAIPGSIGKVFLYRKFPTVEKLAKNMFGDEYVPIPPPEEFASSVMLVLGLSQESKQFVEWRDKACQDIHLPVITVKVKENEVWPVLTVHRSSLVLCCLPFVEEVHCKDLYDIPSVSVAFSILLGIVGLLGAGSTSMDEFDERFVDLNHYLTVSIPFGTPLYTDSVNIAALYKKGPLFADKAHPKQLPYKSKSSISLVVREYIRSTQNESDSVTEIYGYVSAILESLSSISEVNLMLEHSIPGQILSLDSIILHPCVQRSGGSGVSGVPKKFWFMPLLHHFTVCYYTVHPVSLPISGIYKMKGTTSVELFIQLKLHGNINNFHLCDVHIPFFQRGPIMTLDFKATQGFLHVTEDKRSLRWKIGSKFSSKSLDVFLSAKVEFNSETTDIQNEPFCLSENSYIQVYFKKMNETLSGCVINPKSVTFSPALKVKVTTECSVESGDYIIWNTLGDSPFPIIPDDNFPNM